ncbi:Type I restriction-modification system, restriction subunit R [Staphylococcus aureus]|uniref:Type I restriction-modification system, restriction subunit R n=1 Tax=Staphylococcus aureus TaxID=1280 RepID=A0A380DLS9_STAAU|nr:Type I restriction-modification system, restriction subunit R [Staphylococcus aureus]
MQNMLISKVLKRSGVQRFAGERSIDEQALKTISNDYQYSGVVNPHHLKKMIGDLPLKEKT